MVMDACLLESVGGPVSPEKCAIIAVNAGTLGRLLSGADRIGSAENGRLSVGSPFFSGSRLPMAPWVLRCILVGGLGLASSAALAQLSECRVGFPNGETLDLPLAASAEARAVGLSGRDDIGSGMLFAWPEEGMRELWMKNTRVALSAAFIDAGGVVRKVVDMQPYSLQRHGSKEPVRYIIEVGKGDFGALGVAVGSRVGIDCAARR
ncbi:hypothetical protein DNK10_03090 [Pseudomonas daroniae]|nr:hypothetical protein DNK10_03090 [Pseudomonas daroniae]